MKIAIYSKTGCSRCIQAKEEVLNTGMKKAKNASEWVDGTFVERDADEVSKGISDGWRDFPDVDVTAYINMYDIEDLPIIWIDGKCYTYADAMKKIRDGVKTTFKKERVCDDNSCKLTA